jgi:ATP-binding cassette subfamily C protein
VVLVAHRAGVLSRVDRLATMADGMIQQEGPREDVLARLRTSTPTVLARPQ